MSLQLVLGNAGMGKSRFLFQKIVEESMEHPDKNYLILVPEQFTMQIQKEVVGLHPKGGILNIDIASFERLAYRELAEHEDFASGILEETGKSLVLRKVAQDRKGQLTVLGNKFEKTGYISQMKSTVSELMQYQVGEEDMETLLSVSKDRPQLYYKLKDISILYEGFCKYLEGNYVTAEGVLDLLCGYVPDSALLKGATLVLDGYTGFTPVQMKVLGELLKVCEKVYVSLTLDEREKKNSLHLYRAGSPHRLFYLTGQTIENLCQRAVQERVAIDEPLWMTRSGKDRFSHSPALAFLEQNLFRYSGLAYREEQYEIAVTVCRDPRQEMEEIACCILRMVREQGYRYRDFAVITGDMEVYSMYAAWAFSQSEIPYFLDEKHSVLFNPFIECIRSLLDLALEDFSYESVFRFLRCGMTELTDKEIDRLENYCIALGIRGYKCWQEEWVRHYRGQDPKEVPEIDELRKKVISGLDSLMKVMRQRRFTVKEGVIALYQYIRENGMQEKLEKQRACFEQEQEMALEKEYGQIYEIVMDLLDKMIDVLGEEEVSRKEWKELLEAGLSEAKVGIIPPTGDQVVVGDMERTRLTDIKVLFFAGVNENRIPRNGASPGLITDLDREILKSCDVTLAPTERENLCMQRFYLYLAMTKPQDHLYLSYSKTSEKGESIGPAFVIGNLLQMFPSLAVQDAEEKQQKPDAIQTPRQGFSYLAEGFAKGPDQVSDQWKSLYAWYCRQKELLPELQHLFEAVYDKNPQDNIGRETARALYGKVLENSATRLERFSACAFAHFLEYGLGVREREEYVFKSVDLGNIVHQSLEVYSQRLRSLGLVWGEEEEEEPIPLSAESVEKVAGDYGNTILHSTARNEYMISRVKRILNRTVWALEKQVEKGAFIPHRFEVSFAMTDSLDSIQIPLSQDEKLRLRGRIDRLDICETEDKVYVKVIDYKSGNTAFDLVALYHGLQLQLVLYLNAALEMEQKEFPDKEVVPGGIFYYQVQDPMLERDSTETAQEIQERLLKKLRPNGLVAADPEVIEKLDAAISPQGVRTSQVIPVSYNKDGSFSKNSSVASRERFQILGEYVNQKMGEIGREILEGKTQVSPYELGGKNACTYCPYKGVCGFDEKIPGYRFRRLSEKKNEEIWEKMRKDV